MIKAAWRAGNKLVRRRDFIRYCVVGVATISVDIGLLFVLVHMFGVDVYVAATISYWSSLVVNFSLNKIWAFGVIENTSQHVAAYALIICLNYVVGLALIALAQHLGLTYLIGKLAAFCLTTSWNFFLYKYIVFVDNQHAWVRRGKRRTTNEETEGEIQ